MKSLITRQKNSPIEHLLTDWMILTSCLLSVKQHAGIWVFSGYDRDTTPKLAQEKNLVAYRGYSCDTATEALIALYVCA